VKTISLSLLSGMAISLALFWLMQMMISNNQMSFENTDPIHMTEFVRLKRDTKLQTKDRNRPDEPPPPEKRPPPPKMQMQQAQVSQSNTPQMDMPNLDIPLQTSRFGGSLISGLTMKMGSKKISSNLIPLSVTQPRCPLNTEAKRKGGIIKLFLTISKEGAVTDVKILKMQPKRAMKEYCLIRAVKRWKFKPQIRNGIARVATGTKTLELKKQR
jgi:protein TonB